MFSMKNYQVKIYLEDGNIIDVGETVSASDFIAKSEADNSDPTNDEGKVMKLESDGYYSARFNPRGFGSGSDGDVVLNGSTNYNNFSSRSSNEYTLTRDVFANNLEIQSGKTLITNGYKVYVRNILSGAGTIKWGTPNNGTNGNPNSGSSPGSGGAGGAAQSTGGVLRNRAGGNGGNGGTQGNNGSGGSSSASANPSIGAQGGTGGSGGKTWEVGGAGGGSGGSITAPQQTFGVVAWRTYDLVDLNYLDTNQPYTSGATVDNSGGEDDFRSHTHAYGGMYLRLEPSTGGGGGGGGSGRDSGSGGGSGGGGGGASGGTIFIAARIWAGTFTISNVGGDGGAGGNNLNNGAPAGGGGGGAGGVVVVIYAVKTWTGSYTLTGGTGGAAGTGGDTSPTAPTAGSNGSTGVYYEIPIDNLV